MKNKDDLIIIEGLTKGDRNAFKELYQKYSSSLMRQIFSVTNNQELTEEILHETLITAVEKINFYKPKESGSFKAWLMRIATNKSIDLLRKVKKECPPQAENIIPSTEGLSIERESYVNLHGAIKMLPLLQRSAISLRLLEDLSYMEISKVLGVSISSIKQALFKGKKSLKKTLNESEWCDERI